MPKIENLAVNSATILLLSAYDAKSHQHWRRLVRQSLTDYDWTQIALPDRHFSWRIRGNSLTFASQYRELLSQKYDALIVTSMVDLSALRGFIPHLATIPTLIYFHENQFDYPASVPRPFDANRLNSQLTSIYSLLCADKILFNSLYNQQTFFTGANALIKKMPDGVAKGLLDAAEEQSSVLAVPISDDCWCKRAVPNQSNLKPVEIVWNHRWEYDKQPQVLFEALKLLKQAEIQFKIHILGQSFRKVPDCFAIAKSFLADEILTWGYQPLEQYRQILAQADIVVSTAIHDFQGLSMLEAMASGCLPIAPNRVAYPEYIAKQDLYSVTDKNHEAVSLFTALKDKIQMIENGRISHQLRWDISHKIKHYSQQTLVAQYQTVIQKLIGMTKK
ncbi:MAG: DUF3524 domain-containing protein [Enterobacterales bacterium]|nr:DUF3524 domain-containing protein [Enterobacterales bacterium]